jgi:hypothetical protein
MDSMKAIGIDALADFFFAAMGLKCAPALGRCCKKSRGLLTPRSHHRE